MRHANGSDKVNKSINKGKVQQDYRLTFGQPCRSKEMFKKYNALMNCSGKTMDFDKTY